MRATKRALGARLDAAKRRRFKAIIHWHPDAGAQLRAMFALTSLKVVRAVQSVTPEFRWLRRA